MKKTTTLWILAIVLTLSAAYYQKTTGPTYDKKAKISIEQTEYKFKLPRSNAESDCEINLEIPDNTITASLFYRKHPTNDAWTEIKMLRDGDNLQAYLPKQAPAGKLSYYFVFNSPNDELELYINEPITIRFKGNVPAWVLIPHIFFMFFAMLLSNLSGIMAFAGNEKFRYYGLRAFIALLLGGMILGPVVQLYAFGDLWTGIPFGWDLTDNKTLFAFVFWILAVVMNRKKARPIYTIIASIVLLLIYSIPHSMFGSELNQETGEIVQGMICLLPF